MSFSPTDALSMNVTLTKADQSFSFDCLEASYQAQMHGMYQIRALVVSDVSLYAFEHRASNLQLGNWGKVEITSSRFNHSYIFQGVVRKLEGTSKFANGKELVWIECLAECQDLFLNRRSGIYLGASALEIIDRGLTGRFNQLGYKQTEVSKSLSQNDSYYPIQNSMTQFGESDLAFIFRNLSEYGIWANFRQDFTGNSGVTLLLADHNEALNNVGTVDILQKIDHEGAGLYHIEYNTTQVANTVRAIYFDESQNQYVIKTDALPTIGTNSGVSLDHHCLGNLLIDQNVENIATIVKDSLRIKQQILTANFQGLNLQPGDVIQVPFNNNNTPFVITDIEYEFAKGDEERGASAQFSQKHHITAMALTDITGETIPYRAPIWIQENDDERQTAAFVRKYPNYNYRGVLSGCYGMPTGEIVVPDQLGNIPVMFPYNYAEICGNVPARYTRLISFSNQGGVTGRTFPIYKDTELQIMFANGNMDYPLIKGAAANADTGHVHSSTVQQRTHYALPQGQYLTYSNVPGDHNFATMGAQHSEGASRSFMMLSNEQDPNNPGVKKLDQQKITNQSNEQVVSGDSNKFHAGNQNVINGQSQPLPITYIRFVIGDQTNIQNPTVAPMLDDYLQGVSANMTFTHQNGKTNQLSGSALPDGKVFVIKQNLAQTADPTIPVDVTQIQIQLIHNGRNGTDKTVAVNIIAQNSTPIFPTDTITVTASEWQQNKTTDKAGNIYYTVNLNLLAPAILFNFRQDANKLEGDDLATYQALKPYFQEESYSSKVRTLPQFSEHELNFFATQGNNVTIFIHGYNVGFGAWPTAYNQNGPTLIPAGSIDLYQDDAFMQTKCGSSYDSQKIFGVATGKWNTNKMQGLLGTEAHLWLLSMEHNLNVAAGFDRKDYSKYTRLIGINWQGDPAGKADYMAAPGMAVFPAEKIFTLIQQLHAKGIKINLMAHSLGNDVLMHVLELCGQTGIQVDHAFLWEPAIPNNSFGDNSKTKFLPLKLNNNVTNQLEDISYEYNYPNAQQGAQKVTVLYSGSDTILGPIPKGDSTFGVLTHTYEDPAAGIDFAAPAGMVDALDLSEPFFGIHQPLRSIYNVANLFVYPMSYFINGTQESLEAYYQLWISYYPTFESEAGTTLTFSSSLTTQRSVMQTQYPHLFDLLEKGFEVGDDNQPSVAQTYQLSDKEKATAAIMKGLNLLPMIDTLTSELPQLPGSSDQEHAMDVATIILCGLNTPEAQPPNAMGYSSADPSFGSCIQSAQQGPSNTDLCIDHSAMLLPTSQFMQYIYKGFLFSGGGAFKCFGKWIA